ncbi:MAG: hypothetical protein M9932_06095 [Xanthobacteraceae bacterium]|nr:hypothetical protein [Xanthobacteraceae bacterium]
MTDPAPATASTAYDLYYLQNGKRFFWRNPNHGVTLFDAGRQSAIIWRNDAIEMGRQLWTDIAAVNMASGSDGKDVVNSCLIRFRDGRTLTVTDAGASGQVDHDRTPPYRDFVRALHLRLAAAPPGTIRFTAGFSESRHTAMVAILVIAALFFVGTPLVLLFIVRDWRVLGVLAAGIGFVWPFWKIAENNRPRDYDPRHPPGELMD